MLGYANHDRREWRLAGRGLARRACHTIWCGSPRRAVVLPDPYGFWGFMPRPESTYGAGKAKKSDHHSRSLFNLPRSAQVKVKMARVSTKYVRKGKKYQRRGRYKAKSPYEKQLKWTGYQPKLNPRSGIFGFPRELITKIRYSDIYTLTSTSSSIAKNVFRMNSINDLDQSGVGTNLFITISCQRYTNVT